MNEESLGVRKKDYKNWHQVKVKINDHGERKFFHEREIWFCSLGENVGFEQDGKNDYFERPVIVMKKFNLDIFLAIPLTSTPKRSKFYFVFEHEGKEYSAILSQIRLLDAKRLSRKVRVLPEREFQRMKEMFKQLI